MATYSKRMAGEFDWKAALYAGLAAGAIFIVLEMILVALTGASPWAPLRMMAAILLGSGVLPPPATLTVGIFIAAMVVHFALSILFAFILSYFLRRQTMGMALIIGLIFGLALYLVNFYLFTALFPWFAEARNAINVVVHLAFGLSAAAIYVKIRGPIEVTSRRRLEERPA